MQDMNEQVLRIEQKVQQLLKQYQQSQKENLQMKKENQKLKMQLQEETDEKNKILQQNDALRIYSSAIDINSKKELEKRINIYLKDIDKCLALLHA